MIWTEINWTDYQGKHVCWNHLYRLLPPLDRQLMEGMMPNKTKHVVRVRVQIKTDSVCQYYYVTYYVVTVIRCIV